MTLYRKSYLLEIYNKKTCQVTDAFCFSIPPENEELTYTHRISQTKTFGGICVDKYGNEAVKISLSGTTVNQEIRYIYRSSLPAQQMTGEAEIYYLRDMLENVATEADSEMRLYDLSKSNPSNIGTETMDFKFINNWWIVYLDSFKIKRSKEKPLAYGYQIEFTGEPKKQTKMFKMESLKILDTATGKVSMFQKIKNSPAALIAKIDNGIATMRLGLNAMQNALSESKSMFNQILTVKDKVQDFADVFNDYADTLQNFNTFRENAVQQIVQVGPDILKSFTSAGLDIARGVVATAQILYDSVFTLNEIYNEGMKLGWKDCYTEEKLNALETTYEELKDSVSTANYQVIEGANDISASLKKINMPEVIVNTDNTGNDYAVVSYGNKKHTIVDGESMEKIAYKVYGSTDYIPLLENYNGISDDDLEPGKEIKIPVLEPEARDFNNNVFETKESLGTDIKLDESGDLEIFGEDFSDVSGDENLKQAIEVRLSAYMGSNVRNVLYGLRNSTGQNQSSNAYVLASIEQTLLEEPRIAEINAISFSGRGDNLMIEIDYTNINNVKNVYQGVI